jgi:hypothetical protein
MKVGDLVKFSAYGKKLQQNRNVASYDPIGVIIMRRESWPGARPRFYVKWCGLGELFPHGNRRKYLRQDLKYASR